MMVIKRRIRARRLLRWPGICLFIWISGCTVKAPEGTIELPARFEADRIFTKIAVRGGDTLQLFTDTGGGLFIYSEAADRIGWRDSAGILLKDVAVDPIFPEPLGAPDRRIPVFRTDRKPDFAMGDGMLGQAWFADRIWTFDYPDGKLLLHKVRPSFRPEAHHVHLGFLTDSSGTRILSFPRIPVFVDGDTLDMLFDTGATVLPGSRAPNYPAGAEPGAQATSFIISGIFNRWRESHPDWPVIPDADENVPGMSMILVPEVSVAGFSVGPVWFTERLDANFHKFMSQWMDRPVDGAVGGNVFRFFRITVDYPAALAYFLRVRNPG